MLAKAAMVLGGVLIVAGVLGLVFAGGDAATVVAGSDDDATTSSTLAPSTSADPASSASSSTSSTTTSTSTTTTSTTTTTAPPAAETVEGFLALLVDAFAGGDADTLFDRMNQATLDRYGVDRCRAYADQVAGQAQDLALVSSADIGDWDYVTDDLSTIVPDTTAVDVVRTVNDQSIEQTLHWQLVDGRYTWFTDCGDPA